MRAQWSPRRRGRPAAPVPRALSRPVAGPPPPVIHLRRGYGSTVFARVARYEVPGDQLEQAVAAFGEAGRQIEHLDGFAGGYVLLDEEDGRTMTLTLWENTVALENSERHARKLR